MAFSGGVFSLVAGNPVTTATTISSTWANNTLNDIATNGLTMCLLKDGSQTVTGDLPMAGFKITGLGAGTSLTDAASITRVQSMYGSFLTGTAGRIGDDLLRGENTTGQRFATIPCNPPGSSSCRVKGRLPLTNTVHQHAS